MSVRIWQLSKDIGMDKSELIDLLRKRGYEVKNASSTIDNISAESIMAEFATKVVAGEVAGPGAGPVAEDATEIATEAPTDPTPAAPALPPGAIVRTKEDIEKERAEREAAMRKSAVVPQPPPRPVIPARLPGPPSLTPPKAASGPMPPAIRSRFAPPRSSTPEGVVVPTVRTDLPPPPPAPVESSPTPADAKGSALVAPPSALTKVPVTVPPPSPPPAVPPRAPLAGGPPPQPRVLPASPSQPPVLPRAPAPPPIAIPVSKSGDGGVSVEKAGGDGVEAAGEGVAPSREVIQIKPPIVVRDFAGQLRLKPFQLISELMDMGIFSSMNQTIEPDIATRIAEKHGFVLDIKHRGESQQEQKAKAKAPKVVDEAALLEPRPPVVCILGHVDHGKTTLLDAIRQTNLVEDEAGGITQHIGAYQIEHKGHRITFIDTPGHAAFSQMRKRGAAVTDIAILVVAADDGFKPQTEEAMAHARNANVPFVVAINKVDSRGANVDRVKQQMQERGIAPEDLGGETLCVTVSALKRQGISELLDSILLQSEIMELKANPKASPEGVIIEAQKETGLGSTASVIITKGTLKAGDCLVCGSAYCRARSIFDDRNNPIKAAPPSTPVKVAGWSEPPRAGMTFVKVKNERAAESLAEENERERKKLLTASSDAESAAPATLETLFAAIAQQRIKTFPILIKADVFGTAEALADALREIKSDKIKLQVVSTGVGAISRSDVLMASASKASIVGFNVSMENGVSPLAKHHDVVVYQHSIIYEVITIVRDAMAGELEPETRENKTGAAEVRQIFPLARGFVAGCLVTEGRVNRDSKARLLRRGEVLAESSVSTLKRFKDDVTEVRAGYECGIRLNHFDAYEPGDVIECFEILKIKPSL